MGSPPAGKVHIKPWMAPRVRLSFTNKRIIMKQGLGIPVLRGPSLEMALYTTVKSLTSGFKPKILFIIFGPSEV